MKKISRFCLFSFSLVLICGLCACAPDIEKPESEVSFSSSGLQSSGTTSPQEENSLSSCRKVHRLIRKAVFSPKRKH